MSLSNVAQKAMAQPDFDRNKVEAIKKAIQEGNYPINPRRIAQQTLHPRKSISRLFSISLPSLYIHSIILSA